ncbi:gluconokinase [Sphingomonas guangdongensis]|nr:gluconokinase [Sphingomonas guangdongensis]
MGVSGCGKSTLLRALAAALSCPALEGDDYHGAANVAKMRSGQPLDDADRWPWLDRLGTAIGGEVEQAGIAVAACSALKRRYRERLEAAAGVPLLFVLLDGTRAELAARLAERTRHYMPASLLESQLATLERPQADERALTLPCTWRVEQLSDAVISWARSDVAA